MIWHAIVAVRFTPAPTPVIIYIYIYMYIYICAIAFKSAKHKLSNAFPKLLAIKSMSE